MVKTCSFFSLLCGCPTAHIEDSLTHPMLITTFLQFPLLGLGEPRNEVESLSLSEYLVGFNPQPSDSNLMP